MAAFHYFTLLALAIIGGTLSPLWLWGLFTAASGFILAAGCRYGLGKQKMLTVLLIWLVYSYAVAWMHNAVSHRLPIALDKQPAQFSATVIKHTQTANFQQLHLKIQSTNDLSVQQLPQLRQVRLNLYAQQPRLQENDVVQVDAILRSPRSLLNGLAFDYEAWLLGQSIDAIGYIKNIEVLADAPRQNLRSALLAQVKLGTGDQQWPWLAGLIFGEQDAFVNEQWQLAKVTGTLHLLVVSGMHMGLIVLLALAIWAVLLRLWVLSTGRTPVRLLLWRTLFLLAMSGGYLWLAGAGLALQRAWLMLAVVLIVMTLRHQLSWLTAIAAAFFATLLINPVAWLSAGFGYSFLAVLALLLFFSGRKSGRFEALWLPQWVVFSAMLPLFLYWQQPVNFMQCIANLLAIPWLSLVLMPLALAVLLLPELGQAQLLLWAGELFWRWLEYVQQLPLPFITSLPTQTLWLLWPLLLLLLRAGVNYWLGRLVLIVILVVVFFIPMPQRSQATMLDVGQGQSLAFVSSQASLVYDAGPYMGDFDSGEAIVKPVLQQLGVKRISRLIISHQDNDHAGGTVALLNSFVIDQWWGGEELVRVPPSMELCDSHTAGWHKLDEQLSYRILNIDNNAWQYLNKTHNNQSCVAQLDWYGVRFLLVGDIDKSIEFQLIRDFSDDLKSDVLVLGHHGSKTSSSEAFLQMVNPTQAWISAGFNNRFNHPAEEVVQRLDDLDIQWFSTAEQGRIWLTPDHKVHGIRQKMRPPWRNN